MVDGVNDESAAVDMPDETEHDEDSGGGGGTGKNMYNNPKEQISFFINLFLSSFIAAF